MTRRLITKEELAEILGLVRDDGTPMTDGINVKAASGEWPSRLVLGKLRFAEEDVEAILDLCKRGGEGQPIPSPAPAPAKRRRRKQQTAAASVPSAFGDLTPLPIRDRTRAHP